MSEQEEKIEQAYKEMIEFARNAQLYNYLISFDGGRVWHSSEFNPRPEPKLEEATLIGGPVLEGTLLQRNPDGTVSPMRAS